MASYQEMDDETYFKELVKYRNSGVNHFASYVDIEITDAGLGWSKGEVVLQDHHFNPIGSVHGGLLFALADSVGGSAACTRRRPVCTLNSEISYLNAAMDTKKLVAEAHEVKAGKKTCVYQVDIFNDSGVLLVTSIMTYFYLHGEIHFPGAD